MELSRLVSDALSSMDIDTITAASAPGQWRRTIGVVEAIQQADLVVGEVSSQSYNVYFELGVAVGMRKPMLLLARKGEEIPVDILSYQILIYEPGDTRLASYVAGWTRDALYNPRSVA